MNNNSINVLVDSNGYLKNFQDWNENIAINLANLEGITLCSIHWKIIYFARMFYNEYKVIPKIRTILNMINIKYGPQKGNSRYLIKLFPKKTVIQQIAKIAGLPQPTHCL